MNIPDEAVEAAARAAYRLRPATYYIDDSVVAWEQLSGSPIGQRRKDRQLAEARASLEASAAYIAADAWDEGWQKAHATDDPAMAGIFFNPYRSQA